MTNTTPMGGPMAGSAIILVRPKFPENIGATARIACNFGISALRIVGGQEMDEERMLRMATHKAAHLIRDMARFATLREAVEPFQFIVGTTARTGRNRIREQTPGTIMQEVAPLVASGSRVALLFGPEDTGLSNEELDYCQFASTIPTADFSSLNLAQAVAIHCYELYMAITRSSFAVFPEADYANSFDLEGMYEHIDQALEKITFIKDSNHTYWMRAIRQFLGRIRLRKREASLIRGVCRRFLWHYNHFGDSPKNG